MQLKIRETAFSTYESNLDKYRIQFKNVLDPLFEETAPKRLLLFWINFSSLGVGMTEPVEDWVARAGQKCEELGYIELGKQLKKHAVHEANHHLLMIEDTKYLVNEWNKLYAPQIKAEDFLDQPFREAVIKYRDLHEYYIQGKNPYCQIAIEYEIENLAATYGELILNHTIKILGNEIKNGLSFLDEHARIDIAHTQFNKKVISNFIEDYPDTLNSLIEAGKQALQAYGNFLTECLHRARNL